MLFGQPHYQQQPPSQEPTFFDTLVHRNEPGVRSYLIANGYGNVNSPEQMVEALKGIFLADKERVFPELLRLHPDKDMILETFMEKEEKPARSSFSGEQEGAPARPGMWGYPIPQGMELTLDKLGINSSMLNTAIILVVIFLLIKIIKN